MAVIGSTALYFHCDKISPTFRFFFFFYLCLFSELFRIRHYIILLANVSFTPAAAAHAFQTNNGPRPDRAFTDPESLVKQHTPIPYSKNNRHTI